MKNLIKLFYSFCLMLSLTQAIFAATYTVTKVADTNDGVCNATDCSLREAIAAANATAANDTIEFSAPVFGKAKLQTIVLSGTDLIITNNGTLSINGTGTNRLFISGNNTSRVFTVNSGAVTEIKNLRVTGGNAVSTVNTGFGGGIRNSGGTLTLTNVVVTENTATDGGGVSNGGFGGLTLNGCTISANTASGSGGGLHNASGNANVLNLFNSTVSGNRSNSTTLGGGGILANGISFITNSTISGNTAANDGGGIYYNGQGLTMQNATIANNTATNQTGGFHKAVANNNVRFRNNLIAGNLGGASPDVNGAINSLGNNLIQTVGTSTGWIASDILNQSAAIGNLGDNGGLTQTHALELNSPAIDAGSNCVTNLSCPSDNPPFALTTDQRGAGFPRLSGTAVDIGAFEVSNTTSSDRRTPFDFDGDGRTDYGVFRPSTGTWILARSLGGLLTRQFGSGTDRITPEDFDGDNRTDLAFWRSGDFAFFHILNSIDNTVRIEQFGTTGDDPRVVGDWDGDGRVDLAVYREASVAGGQSFFFYRPSTQPEVSFIPIRWGTFGDEPVKGDFDGDGRLDPAVYRASDNTWYILQSSNSQPRYVRFGMANDIPVTGDFDGDGKTDIGVFRDGLWRIILSSTGQQLTERLGAAGDRLVLGDYDGDGKTDLAVWRDGVFSVLLSGSGVQTSFELGDEGDIPVADSDATSNRPPVAVAGANVTSGPAPLTVNFSSQGSFDPDGSIVSYSWNFGDGTSSTNPNPVKVYNSAGTFTAVLTVTDNNGLTSTASVTITVTQPPSNQPPVAVAGANVTSGPAPLTVNFSSQGSFDPDGSIVSYSWDFGDGTGLSNQPNPTHTYNNVGNFTATLTVTDNNGATNSRSIAISVQQPPASNYTLVAAPERINPGGQFTVNWTAPSGSATLDWIGLFRVGAANSEYLSFNYTNGATSGSFTVTAPNEPGQYEFRYLLNNSLTSVKTSNIVNVVQPRPNVRNSSSGTGSTP